MSLRTDSLIEARARHTLTYRALHQAWEARLRGQVGPAPCFPWEGRAHPTDDVESVSRADFPPDPAIRILLELLEKIVEGRLSPGGAAPLGHGKLPRLLVSEMPAVNERIRADRIAAKNGRQLREWRNKYLRATEAFITVVGNRFMAEITSQVAQAYRTYWDRKRETDQLTTQYVNKQIAYMAQLVDSFYKDAELLPTDYNNPFSGLALERLGSEIRQEEGRKLTLPAAWIRDVLLNPACMAGLNDEARDIAIVCAETGARITEVVDLSPDDIDIGHEIPHLRLLMVEEGEHRRELKNVASTRDPTSRPIVGGDAAASCGLPTLSRKSHLLCHCQQILPRAESLPTAAKGRRPDLIDRRAAAHL